MINLHIWYRALNPFRLGCSNQILLYKKKQSEGEGDRDPYLQTCLLYFIYLYLY